MDTTLQKPPGIQVDLDAIPGELKNLDQWVCWSWEQKGGAWTKPPINPRTGKYASNGDPSHWGSFDLAVKAYRNNSKFAGIGFVFTEGDLYSGIDLDDCRDPDTGEIEPWAMDIIKTFASYAEVSPSQTGVKLFVRGTLPGPGKKKGNVEVYDRGRYFCTTGHFLDGFETIEDRQELLSGFYQEYFGTSQRKESQPRNNGNGFFWDGDINSLPIHQEKKRLILEGAIKGERSEALISVVDALVWANLPDGVIHDIFSRYPIGKKFQEKGASRERWLNSQIAKARAFVTERAESKIDGSKRPEPIEWETPIAFNDYSCLPEFPIDVLPSMGRKIVKTVSEVVQIDPGIVASIYLGVNSLCLQKKVVVDLQTHKESLSLYLVSIAESGERKSESFKIMTDPLFFYQKNQKIRLLADDVTQEKLGGLMTANNEKMGVFSSEGHIFSLVAGLYTDKHINLNLFLKSHCGDPWAADRVARESLSMENPALAICLTVQPDVITGIGKIKEFRGRGLLARFLYCFGKSLVGFRTRQSRAIPDKLLTHYREHISGLLAIPVNEEPGILTLSPEGQDLWDEFYNDVEGELRSGASMECLRDWGSKLPGAVARIAAIVHMGERGAKGLDVPLSLDTVSGACLIGAFYKAHALATFGFMQADPRVEAAKKVLGYLEREKPKTFKGRDVLRHTWLESMEKVLGALMLLEERGFIRQVEKNNLGMRGRPGSAIYEVNPIFLEKH